MRNKNGSPFQHYLGHVFLYRVQQTLTLPVQQTKLLVIVMLPELLLFLQLFIVSGEDNSQIQLRDMLEIFYLAGSIRGIFLKGLKFKQQPPFLSFIFIFWFEEVL